MSRRPFALYAITRHGLGHAARLLEALPGADLYASDRVRAGAPAGALPLATPMGPLLADTWKRYDCHVHIISVGAVIRMIAPLLENKKVDPAVLAIDDAGAFTICLLSGHVGRGNEYTHRLARILGNTAVVTTASDAIGTLTVDILGRELGWTLDDPDRNVTAGCAAVVNAEPVLFVQETGEPHWWPLDQPLPPGVSYGTGLDGVDPAAYSMLLIASDRAVARSHPEHFARAVVYRPRSLVLGLGCDKGTPAELVLRGISHHLEVHGLAFASVQAIASIDLKAEEPAFLELAARFGWAFHTFPAAQLDVVPGIENPSEVVKKHVGARAVAEPAALLAAGAERLLVPKSSYTEPGAGRSMTLAVARIPFAPRLTRS